MPDTKALHGARIIIRIQGRKVGYMAGINISESYEQQPIDPVGQLEVAEHVVTAYRVRGDGEKFRIYGQDLTSLGIAPSKTSIQDILNHPELLLEVEDIREPGTVERLRGMRVSENNRSYQKGQLSMERFSFNAIKVTTEAEN